MATALEFFEKSVHLQVGQTIFLRRGEVEYAVRVEVVEDFDAGAKYLKIYIPQADEPGSLLIHVLARAGELIWPHEAGVQTSMGIVGSSQSVSNSDLRFTGRVLVYTPNQMTELDRQQLKADAGILGFDVLVRDEDFVKLREKYDVPLAFISHDSRDKEPFVRELASTLSSMLCPVWYDEYRLQPGDSLREKIEHGLKTCSKCIVVLSKNFFANPGWGRREFDSIYSREIAEGRRVMIPIWLDVGRDEVYDYSPSLVDVLGIPASIGVAEVARKVMVALNYEPPPSLLARVKPEEG